MITVKRSIGLASLVLPLALALTSTAWAQARTAPESFQEEHHRLSLQFAHQASRLEHDLGVRDVGVAETLYRIERGVIALLRKVADAPAPRGQATEREVMLGSLRMLLQRVLTAQERVQQHAITTLDRVLPGEPQPQRWARMGNDLSRPLFRMGTPDPSKPAPSAQDRLQEMKQDFLNKGGKMSDIKTLSAHYVDRLESGQLAEWAQVGRKIRLTTEGAKHPLMGQGRSVRGAGSLKVYKDGAGNVLLAVVSNSSGNYKPGPGATEGVVQQLRKLGVSEGHILVTSIIPEEPELVKLLMKSKSYFSKEEIYERVQQLRVATRSPAFTPSTTAGAPRGSRVAFEGSRRTLQARVPRSADPRSARGPRAAVGPRSARLR